MGKCVECQENIKVIGTEKFSRGEEMDNFSIGGICYTIMIVCYCEKCNILFLREPKKVYG